MQDGVEAEAVQAEGAGCVGGRVGIPSVGGLRSALRLVLRDFGVVVEKHGHGCQLESWWPGLCAAACAFDRPG